MDLTLDEEVDDVLDWVFFGHWVDEGSGAGFVDEVSEESVDVYKVLELAEDLMVDAELVLLIQVSDTLKLALDIILIQSTLGVMNIESGESKELIHIE